MTAGVASALEQLERWGAERSWIGPDPYEGLNSPAARLAPGRRGRQALTQAYKRAPAHPPWPLRAEPRANPKALALALSGYATSAGGSLPSAERFLAEIPDLLAELGAAGGGWGYPFGVQTRRIRYAPTTPNAIVTCFVVEGLLDAQEADGDGRCSSLALQARDVLMSMLERDSGEPYFAYVPQGSDLIHNANLLVCGALARLEGVDPAPGVAEAVRASAATTVRHQLEDGLWRYGEAPGYEWIDSFHTAYTLDGLARVEALLGGFEDSLERGREAWRAHFVRQDGWTPYYHDRPYPLETHCAASAIDLLATTGVPGDPDLGASVAARAIEELWLSDEGRFAFRLTRRGLNRREFMRWTNAPMFRALARLASALDG